MKAGGKKEKKKKRVQIVNTQIGLTMQTRARTKTS